MSDQIELNEGSSNDNVEGERVEAIQMWKIGEFTDILNRYCHEIEGDDANVKVNTVNNYFRDLESKLIHYVNRINGTKVYDQLDLNIAKAILDKRRKTDGFDNGWGLKEIYQYISTDLKCRPFPTKEEGERSNVTEELAAVLNKFRVEMNQQYQEIEKKQNVSSQLLLEQSIKTQEAKIKKGHFDLFMKQKEFRREAVTLWEELPNERRYEGLFFKREKLKEREEFIEDYVEKKLMELIINMDLEDTSEE